MSKKKKKVIKIHSALQFVSDNKLCTHTHTHTLLDYVRQRSHRRRNKVNSLRPLNNTRGVRLSRKREHFWSNANNTSGGNST